MQLRLLCHRYTEAFVKRRERKTAPTAALRTRSLQFVPKSPHRNSREKNETIPGGMGVEASTNAIWCGAQRARSSSSGSCTERCCVWRLCLQGVVTCFAGVRRHFRLEGVLWFQ